VGRGTLDVERGTCDVGRGRVRDEGRGMKGELVGYRYAMACKEGPVFKADLVEWE
jgi:hypothetical protein